MLRILAFGPLKDDTFAMLAYWCATVKFAVGGVLVILGAPFALGALAHRRTS